jgi:hypothetical protein
VISVVKKMTHDEKMMVKKMTHDEKMMVKKMTHDEKMMVKKMTHDEMITSDPKAYRPVCLKKWLGESLYSSRV